MVAAVAVVRGGATAGCTLRGGGGGAPSPQCRHRLPATHGSGQWGRHAKQQQPPGRGVGAARAEPAHDPARPVCVGAGQRRAHRLLRDPDSAVRVRAASDGALLRGALLRGAGGGGETLLPSLGRHGEAASCPGADRPCSGQRRAGLGRLPSCRGVLSSWLADGEQCLAPMLAETPPAEDSGKLLALLPRLCGWKGAWSGSLHSSEETHECWAFPASLLFFSSGLVTSVHLNLILHIL